MDTGIYKTAIAADGRDVVVFSDPAETVKALGKVVDALQELLSTIEVVSERAEE